METNALLRSEDDLRDKVRGNVASIARRYHFCPKDGQLGGKRFHKNLVFMALSYLLDRNHLLVGEPGWGKTTGAKIISAVFSGIPYDTFDSLEIRGNPNKYEEKIVARPNYASLIQGKEEVVWQGTFALPVIVVDEINRLPPETQDVILQGIDTSRWNYLNFSWYEGKKPTFMTMNEVEGDKGNGLLPALRDRIDIVTEESYYTSFILEDLEDAKELVVTELCDFEFTDSLLAALQEGIDAFKAALRGAFYNSSIRNVVPVTMEEKQAIQEKIRVIDFEDDAKLFLQAFMAEINYSDQYGRKRASDVPNSNNLHDKQYAGFNVRSSFSPRSVMSAKAYARGIAWFLGDDRVSIEHVMFVLPHVYAHKAIFTDDYINQAGNEARKDMLEIHLAKKLVSEVYERFQKSIQEVNNFIARVQRNELNEDDKRLIENPSLADYPLLRDAAERYEEHLNPAFYEE